MLHVSESWSEKSIIMLASIMTPCYMVGVYKHFREICCLILQGISSYETVENIFTQNIYEKLYHVIMLKTSTQFVSL